ncbi:MAG: carboxylesterase family protein [bacterium]|nr:carboxylesterase family protein [bacterium]
MKKCIVSIVIIILVVLGLGTWYVSDKTVKCNNGIFMGKNADKTDVLAFKGIPYAQKPVGDLRWKAPLEAPKSNKPHFAFKYNTLALQNNSPYDFEEFKTSEDCLKLNIWTSDLKGKNKPVMVYFHGGAYGWEGIPYSIYDAQYLVNEYKDIIVVSIDYRVNLMGFSDFSDITGGENFKDAPYLGILDCIMGLKWVNQNIEKFGGDPNNITIFGESAGGGIVSILMTLDDAQGLFKRVIAQSGTLNLTSSLADFKAKGQAKAFLDATGSKNMDDLMKLNEKQIVDAMKQPSKNVVVEGVSGVGYLNNMPLKGSGSIIAENPYKVLENGLSKDVDLMIGTNADEFRYWILEMQQDTLDKNFETYSLYIKARAQLADKNLRNKYMSVITTDNDKYSEKYKDIWKNTELGSDLWFRMPSIKTAESHIKANGKGKTYIYYYEKRCDINDWRGAAHAAELPYVFYNLNYKEYGSVDKELAKNLSNAWVNFARTGNPSTDFAQWTQYDLKDRNTMVIGNDNSMTMKKDYKGIQRQLLDGLIK